MPRCRRHLFVFLLLFIIAALAGCDSPREQELKRLWADAVRQDQITGYLNFLAAQKREEDTDAGDVLPAGEKDGNRSVVARRRMFQLALDKGKNSCPFKTLYVDTRQNIRNVRKRFYLSSSNPGKLLSLLGVTITTDPASADDKLILSLTGTATFARYYNTAPGGGPSIKLIGGGTVNGSMQIASQPQFKVFFKGSKEARGVVSSVELKYAGQFFPKGMLAALDAALFNARLAELLLEVCGPEVAALIYFGNSLEKYGASKSIDQKFERRLAAEYEAILPIAISAAFGSRGRNLFYDRSEKAARFLLGLPWPDRRVFAAAWVNTATTNKIPDWLQEFVRE